ncbi:MAG: hypothetical protein WA120_07675, partial [Candidatus Hydromicrobium sp.]
CSVYQGVTLFTHGLFNLYLILISVKMLVNSKPVDNFNLNLTIEIWNLRQDFGEVKFIQIFREENSRADSLVNRELSSQNRLF